MLLCFHLLAVVDAETDTGLPDGPGGVSGQDVDSDLLELMLKKARAEMESARKTIYALKLDHKMFSRVRFAEFAALIEQLFPIKPLHTHALFGK